MSDKKDIKDAENLENEPDVSCQVDAQVRYYCDPTFV